MSSLPNRCLVKEQQNDRELILPTSAIMVRDSNSGLLKVASKSDIESNVPVYMQSGENVVEIEMLRYAESKKALLSLQRSSSKKRIRVMKKLSLTPYQSKPRNKTIANKTKKKLPANEIKKTKKFVKTTEKTFREKSMASSDSNIIKIFNDNKENNNILSNQPTKDQFNVGKNAVDRELTSFVEHTRRSVLENTPRTPLSSGSKTNSSSFQHAHCRAVREDNPRNPALSPSHLPTSPSDHTRKSVHENTPRTSLLSGSRISSSSQQHTRRSVHESTPRTPLSSGSRISSSSQRHTCRLVHENTPRTSLSSGSRISSSSQQHTRRSVHESTPRTPLSSGSRISSSSQRHTCRLVHENTPRTSLSSGSRISSSSQQHTRRLVHENTPRTPLSSGSRISLSSLQYTRRSVHENTPRTPLSSGSRISLSSLQHTRRSVHENTPRTSLSSRSRISSSSQQHTRRSVHESTPRTPASSISKESTLSANPTRRSAHKGRPHASRSRHSAPQHFNNARNSSSESEDSSSSTHSSRSSSPSSPSDFDDIVNTSQLQQGLKLFRKKIVSDVKKVLLKNNLGRPSTDNNGKVEIEGIPLDAKNFLRALSAKKMSLRAKRLMRAYWTENDRDKLITRKNKKFPNALIISSRNYNDFINLCYALQRTRFLKHSKKQNPENNIYQWVKDFLKNDRFARKKLNEKSEISLNRRRRAKSI